jgi:hypothetical protein
MVGARTPTGIPGPPRRHGGGRPAIDLAGDRYGKLLVVERVPKPTAMVNGPGVWFSCECNCGRTAIFSSERLRSGKVLDCDGAWHRRR